MNSNTDNIPIKEETPTHFPQIVSRKADAGIATEVPFIALPTPTIVVRRVQPVQATSLLGRKHKQLTLPRILNAKELKKRAEGLWPRILEDAGMYASALRGTHGRPCPKCDGTDRYAPFSDFKQRGSVYCRNCFCAESKIRPGDGIATLQWWRDCSFQAALQFLDDWFNQQLPDDVALYIERYKESIQKDQPADLIRFRTIAEQSRLDADSPLLNSFAQELSVDARSLHQLWVGHSDYYRAMTWPMRHPTGRITGIRLRSTLDGAKSSVKGSKDGLFIFDEMLAAQRLKRILVCEGPTDTAAMLSLGFDAIGTSSAGAAESTLRNYLGKACPREVVFLADNDSSETGLRGALKLAQSSVRFAPCRVISPPKGIKDARDWLKSGADRKVIETVIDSSDVLTLSLKGMANGS
jgi:hypothetical protein